MNTYKDQIINGQMHIWLQFCGFCPAKLATEFIVGDRIAYNTGVSYEVVAIEEKSKCFLTFTVKNPKSGELDPSFRDPSSHPSGKSAKRS